MTPPRPCIRPYLVRPWLVALALGVVAVGPLAVSLLSVDVGWWPLPPCALVGVLYEVNAAHVKRMDLFRRLGRERFRHVERFGSMYRSGL